MTTGEQKVVRTVAELKELIGQEIGVGKWYTVTQEAVNAFADVTGDHQYIHVDPERAAKTMFGGTIAHGYFTLSLLPMLNKDRDGVKFELGGKMGVNYGLNKVRFPGPVRVGKRIRSRTKLVNVEEFPNCVQMTNEVTIEVEGEQRPGCIAESLGRTYF